MVTSDLVVAVVSGWPYWSDLVADVIVKSGRVVFDSMVNSGLCC